MSTFLLKQKKEEMIPIRILFFLYLPNPFPSAAWIRIEFFAQYFKSIGKEVTVSGVFSLKSLSKAGGKKLNGVRILNITPIIMTTNLFSLTFNILSSFFSSLISLMLLRPQLVVISVPNGETAFASYIAAKLFRTKKVVIDYRDEWEDHNINKAKSGIYKKSYSYLKDLMTQCYTNSDLVVTTTESFADKLKSRGVRNVNVVANGADINIFKPYDRNNSRSAIGINEHDFVLVYSGSIGVYYRLDIVIRAMQKVSNKIHNMKLLIVGQGNCIQEILNLSKQLGLQNNVFYLGAKIDKVELAKIFSASDVGIVPYDTNPLWKNSMPVKALEYLACGVPIIATVSKDSVLGKLIYENKIGILARPENVDSLAHAIEKMYNYYCSSEKSNDRDDADNNSFIKEVSKRAMLLVKKNFDRKEIAKHFLTLLENAGKEDL